jgi:hypothetical protein
VAAEVAVIDGEAARELEWGGELDAQGLAEAVAPKESVAVEVPLRAADGVCGGLPDAAAPVLDTVVESVELSKALADPEPPAVVEAAGEIERGGVSVAPPVGEAAAPDGVPGAVEDIVPLAVEHGDSDASDCDAVALLERRGEALALVDAVSRGVSVVA